MANKDWSTLIVALLLGALTFAFLNGYFVASWQVLYVGSSWPSLSELVRRGVVEPWLVDSPLGLRVTEGVLFGLSLLVGLIRGREPWSSAFAVWLGVMLPLVPVLVARSLLSNSRLLTMSVFGHGDIPSLAILYEAVRTGLPIFAGILIAMVLVWLGRVLFSSK